MTNYQNMKAIGFSAMAAFFIADFLAIFAVITGNIPMVFFAGGGAICAFVSICAVDSLLADQRRAYTRRVRS